MKISFKILLGFLLVFVLISLSGLPTGIYYHQIGEAFGVVVERDMVAINFVVEMEKVLLEADAALARNAHHQPEVLKKRFLSDQRHWHILRAQLNQFLQDDAATIQSLTSIDRATRKWFDDVEEILKGESNRYDQFPALDSVRAPYNELLELQRERLSANYASTVRTVDQTSELEWSLRVCLLIIGLLTCFLVIRSVKNPLNRLMKATQSIAEGRFEKIAVTSRDELGQLTQSFNQMSQSLKERTAALEEQRRLAVQASQLKTEFLANTSHELRTPLNTIIGYTQLILEGLARDAKEERKYMATVQQSSKHLLALINDVLDIARIEAGQMTLDLEPVSVTQAFEGVVEQLSMAAEKKGLKLTTMVGDGVGFVHANPSRLNQVLLNLVGNAIKFTNKGSVALSARRAEAEGMVCIRVQDTGIGISAEKQRRLFQKFVQADGSMTRSYGGTGLGLALSKTLLELMEGSIELFSEGEGKGVTLAVYLKEEVPFENRGNS